MLKDKLIWADLHNHNEIGYGRGSLERAARLARERLDIWAFTAHGAWPDLPQNPEDPAVRKHLAGFAKVRENWPLVLRSLEAATQPGRFIALAGFEWHSSKYGDRHVLAPVSPLQLPGIDIPLTELKAWAEAHEALLIPHHLAYPPASRAVDWATVDERLSPVAEIFSEHGCSEADDAPWPMDGHSMSPRSTVNCWRTALDRGLHLGAVASTDNHEGCPGAYNEGLTGLWVENFSVAGLFAALRRRRTFAVTGDRLVLDWSCLEVPMGETVSLSGRAAGGAGGLQVPLRFWVAGRDAIDCIDLICNGRLWRRWTPGVDVPEDDGGPGPEFACGKSGGKEIWLVRGRWGWGRMGNTAVNHWKAELKVAGGEVLKVEPGFGSVPPEGGADGTCIWSGGPELSWSSRTSRAYPQCYDQLLLEVAGDDRTRLELEVECRLDEKVWRRRAICSLGELRQHSCEVAMDEPPLTPRFQWARALPAALCTVAVTEQVVLSGEVASKAESYIYIRVRQRNGQMAWSSPIWLKP
ncbi:MAG TPA: hypothetical protein GXX29_07655 [Firmicutes bacterium]|nr:hypothetical protein [Bacillota bacterium]